MSNGGTIRLINVRVIDGTGAAPMENGEIVATDGRLAYVGPRREHAGGISPVHTVDGGGRTVLPGFFDTHVHVTTAIEKNTRAVIADTGTYATLETARRLRETLDAGVTTIRDLGGLDHGMQRALAEGLIAGPRARIAVSVISPTGGHADMTLPNGTIMPVVNVPTLSVADTDEEMLTLVRRLIRSGADVIKVCTSGGVSSPTDQPDDLGVTERQIALIRDELDRHSRPRQIAAHAQGTAGILAAIRGGVDSVEHGYAINDEGIDLMLEKGTYLVPTLSAALRVPDPALVPGYLYEKKVRWSQLARENIARAIEAGVTVALGTDVGVCPHGRNLLELAHMVELGMSPADAIVAGTANAARLLGLADDLGTLETGKIADLVAVSVDPLTDITALADPDAIELVVQNGRIVKDLSLAGAEDARRTA
ncbi:amidohydrolase family protein [Nocardia nova SH22a]|uniref:Amidohydrolase family protein n=1 Tax=Nocardia nova SH22a TaxID=1415166 RepID=W5TP32_9NOCA|nr:amidohydrolase family protein [Nocardia nova]AHH21012.1 amidohydrolase family protein [Nocardia nova SH22a]